MTKTVIYKCENCGAINEVDCEEKMQTQQSFIEVIDPYPKKHTHHFCSRKCIGEYYEDYTDEKIDIDIPQNFWEDILNEDDIINEPSDERYFSFLLKKIADKKTEKIAEILNKNLIIKLLKEQIKKKGK